MVKIEQVVGLTIGIILIAVLLPIGIDLLVNMTTTDWDPAVVTLLQVVLPILAVIGLVATFIPKIDN